MADAITTKRAAIALGAGLLAIVVGWRMCAKDDGKEQGASSGTASKSASASSGGLATGGTGLSAPIAAAHAGSGDVFVAGLDVPSKAIRVQRINAKDEVVGDKIVLGDVTWSPDSELKLVANAKEGVAVTWRGLRGGKLVRQLAILGPDLAPKGEPAEVSAASCATRDTVWSSDGVHAFARPWVGEATKLALPKDKDASLLCGASRAFAILEDEDRTSILTLGPNAAPALAVVRESEFGDDEQRELSEYTVGDDVGFVRLGGSGAVAVRELTGGNLGPLRKLKTTIPKDDDVVAVDASSKILAIVYTQDASSACPAGDSAVATKVMALRVDRTTFEESTVELSPGRCGHEVGPFFTGVLGDGVSIAWAERSGEAGKARAPITALAHGLVMPSAAPSLGRIEQPADAVVDAGCDATTCYAVALVRRETPDVPGVGKVLR
jgi:hypothetical protein